MITDFVKYDSSKVLVLQPDRNSVFENTGNEGLFVTCDWCFANFLLLCVPSNQGITPRITLLCCYNFQNLNIFIGW